MTAPEFVELSEHRNYIPGLDAEDTDIFNFIFDLALNDTDLAEPVTATLEYAEIGSDSWSTCPMLGASVLTATYTGSDPHWNCDELAFDILMMDMGSARGIMKQARISVDYTLLNGVTGTVYSSDIADMFLYSGQYVTEVSSSYEFGVASSTFRIDPSLVLDLSKVELTELTISSYKPGYYMHELDILNDADITPFAEDGTFTVTYAVPGDGLDPLAFNDIFVRCLYEDHEGFIYWESADSSYLDVPQPFTAPTLDSAHTEESDAGYSYIPFEVTVGDGTKYAALTATLEHWNGSGYETFVSGSGPATVNTLSLDHGDDTDSWVTGPSGDCLIADLEAENGFGFFRVALRYVDDAGAVQYVYSDPMTVYKGTYVVPDTENSMDVGDGYFYAYYQVDMSLVDIDKVETVEFTATSPEGNDILLEVEWFTLDKSTGEVSVRGQVDCYGPEAFDRYTAKVKLMYSDTEAGPAEVYWQGEAELVIELNPEFYGGYVPDVLSVDVVDGFDGLVYITFALRMNEAETVKAKLYRVDGADSYSFYECDTSLGTVELFHDNLNDYVENWITSPGDQCLCCSIPNLVGMPGAFYRFYIEFECSMPDGELWYVYSLDVPAFRGSFFDLNTEYSMYAVYNPVNEELSCTWKTYRSLAPDISAVRVQSVRLTPDDDTFTPIDLPTDSVTLYAGDDGVHDYARVLANGVVLSIDTEWTLMLTLDYEDEQYTWTSPGIAQVAWMNKSPIKTHHPITPPKGPAGGIYHEEKE